MGSAEIQKQVNLLHVHGVVDRKSPIVRIVRGIS